MNLVLDDDVQSVLEFIQREIQTARLVAVAEAVAAVAPVLWGHWQREVVRPLELQAEKVA